MKTITATLLVFLFCLPTVSTTTYAEPIKNSEWDIPLSEVSVAASQCLEAMKKGLLVQTGTGLSDPRVEESSYFLYDDVLYKLTFRLFRIECEARIPLLTKAR